MNSRESDICRELQYLEYDLVHFERKNGKIELKDNAKLFFQRQAIELKIERLKQEMESEELFYQPNLEAYHD